MNKGAAFVAAAFFGVSVSAHEVEAQTGLLKNAIAPKADFGVLLYKHGQYRVGAFTSPEREGVVASYASEGSPFRLELGQREKSLAQGFVISNGAYLPWSRNFAYGEPIGARFGYATRFAGIDAAYYQKDQQNIAIAQVSLSPTPWLRFVGGAQKPQTETAQKAEPTVALELGERKNPHAFNARLEYAGAGNTLVYAGYSGAFRFRGLAFQRSSQNSMASGIYNNSDGIAAQFFSDAWFAQYFQTDTRFGMLRYGGSYLTAVAAYEEKSQLAGVSLRNNPTGFHLRAGATLGVDTSLQTLAGFGYADFVFIGGGPYTLYSEQMLEPILFPADWYSSVLLQSSSMKIKDKGFKMMALVDTEFAQGFVAIAYAEDYRGRERFTVFFRLAGSLQF